MKFATVPIASGLVLAARGETDSPIGKVVQMLSDLQAKIIKEGQESQKVFAGYSEWCEDRAANLGHDIKTGHSEAQTLKASITSEESTIASLSAKVEDLAGEIATDEADLKAATHIRTAEASNFAASEKELVETISMLERAVGILEREMAKGSASMLQTKGAQGLADALKVMVQASMMNSADASRLTALVQQGAQADSDDDADEPGAPAAAVYQGQGGNIIDTLKDLKDKADEQLDDARKKETANHNNFQLLQQSLTDEIRFGNKDVAEAKKGSAASGEAKATAEGDLKVTSKELASDLDTKATLHHDCMTKAEDFEAETKSRGQELEALAAAKKALTKNTGGAADISYSFMQTSSIRSAADLAHFEAVRLVRDLARKENSASLAQLAQRMASAARSSDPFGKIKGLISDMIEKLESEADADATKKAYCDKETKETTTKKEEKTAEISKLSTRIDRMKARSALLEEEVAALQNALAKLAGSQSEMNKLRDEEHTVYVSNKADMEQGLVGVKLALKILGEYYAGDDKAHEASSGAGTSVIGLLEVVESDFTKGLAEIVATEEAAAAEYDRQSKDNEVDKTAKTKDVEYKTKESTYLEKESAELSSDREGVQAELDAVLEYLAKINEQCIAKAETYSERKRRRTAEIAGLKEALTILESETALVQKRSFHRGKRAAFLAAM